MFGEIHRTAEFGESLQLCATADPIVVECRGKAAAASISLPKSKVGRRINGAYRAA